MNNCTYVWLKYCVRYLELVAIYARFFGAWYMLPASRTDRTWEGREAVLNLRPDIYTSRLKELRK
jgi:hypothetical protein